MVDSKVNTRRYFLPIYAVFAIVSPTITFYMSGYLMAPVGEAMGAYLPWDRVAAFYALFGLIWPLTIVISPGFFHSVKLNTGFNFFQALGASGPLATKAIVAYILLSLAWILPVILFAIALFKHKRDVGLQTDSPDTFGWIDYFASFI